MKVSGMNSEMAKMRARVEQMKKDLDNQESLTKKSKKKGGREKDTMQARLLQQTLRRTQTL